MSSIKNWRQLKCFFPCSWSGCMINAIEVSTIALIYFSISAYNKFVETFRCVIYDLPSGCFRKVNGVEWWFLVVTIPYHFKICGMWMECVYISVHFLMQFTTWRSFLTYAHEMCCMLLLIHFITYPNRNSCNFFCLCLIKSLLKRPHKRLPGRDGISLKTSEIDKFSFSIHII